LKKSFVPPKILITGPPGCGKTTLMEKLIASLDWTAVGFLTGEIRSGGGRVGFDVETLGGERGPLARAGLPSPARVGRYGVDVHGFEEMLEREFSPERMAGAKIVFMDEIGPMEWHSEMFRQLTAEMVGGLLPLAATISLKGPAALQDLKSTPGVVLITLPPWKRDPGAASRVFHAVREKLGLPAT
jgi:nucleoside-triphosphatase